MPEEALRRIREARDKGPVTLDLSACGLYAIPEELLGLTSLTGLDLSSNVLTDVKPLSGLTSLINLNLRSNQLTDVNPLTGLTSLRFLHLSVNQLTDVNPLTGLTSLTALDLSHNQLTDVNPLTGLTSLRNLDLSGNQLTDANPLTGLTSLRFLELSDNLLTDITPLAGLASLGELHLGGNQLTDITPLAGLTSLVGLDLSDNQLTDITPLAGLLEKGLVVNTGYGTPDCDISILGNPLQQPPLSIIEKGNEAILDYIRQMKGGSKRLAEAKLIIVGEPEAGKSTLVEKLIDPDYEVPQRLEATHGVRVIPDWTFELPDHPGEQFETNIWDFGGQQIQYMTHQFFLTPGALYVLLSANDRREPTHFPYWFRIIHLLGEERGAYSPVLVVLNEKNKRFFQQFNLDRGMYEKRYPELQIEVCEVDFRKNDAQFQALREKIQSMLARLPHVNQPRPAKWGPVRLALREDAKENDYISFERFAEICCHHGVEREEDQLLLSYYFHRLGSLLHFQEDPALRDLIILNPQWAADAVYAVLVDNEIAAAGGHFSREKLDTVWHDYTRVERGKLLSLMKMNNFEICYALDEQGDHFIVPQLLNDSQPGFPWNEEDTLKFRFRYQFMPEGVITRLIVRLSGLIASEEERDLVWRRGVVLEHENCRARVVEEQNQSGLKVIDIAVSGVRNERKFLLRRVRDEVLAIHHKWFRNIACEQMVPCNCAACVTSSEPTYFEFSELRQYQDQGEKEIICSKERIKRVSVLSLLEGVFEQEEYEKPKLGKVESGLTFRQEIHIHSSRPQPAPATPPVTPLETGKWYQEWWVVSLVVSVLAGGITWLSFGKPWPGPVVFVLLFFGMYFFDPKRRFFRAGMLVLSATLFNAVPLFSAKLDLSQKLTDGWIDFLINGGEPTNPWLTALLFLGGLVLMVLDFLSERKTGQDAAQ